MIDAREFLNAGQQLHGHKCPAMPLGLRAGAAAMNALAVARARDKELAVVLELGDAPAPRPWAASSSSTPSSRRLRPERYRLSSMT